MWRCDEATGKPYERVYTMAPRIVSTVRRPTLGIEHVVVLERRVTVL